MKRIYTIIILMVLVQLSARSQSYNWTKTYGSTSVTDEVVRASVKNASGNSIYITGTFSGTINFLMNNGLTTTFTSNGQTDIFIAKLNSSGNMLWVKQIGGDRLDVANAITLDAFENVYIGGAYTSSVNVDFDPGAGQVFRIPFNASPSFYQSDAFLLKLNSSGDYVWVQTSGGGNGDAIVDLDTDSQNNILAIGNHGSPVFTAGSQNINSLGNSDIFTLRYNNAGSLLTLHRIAGSGNDQATSITAGGGIDYFIGGHFTGSCDFNPSASMINSLTAFNQDGFVAYYNSSQNYSWAYKIGEGGADAVTDMAYGQTSGGLSFVGYFQNQITPIGALAPLTHSNRIASFIGNIDGSVWSWLKKVEGALGSSSLSQENRALKVAIDASGNVYVAGTFNDPAFDFNPGSGVANLPVSGARDLYTLKLDASGNYVWALSYGGSADDLVYDITKLNAGDELITNGYFSNTADFDHTSGVANFTSSGSFDGFVNKIGSCSATTPTTPTLTANGPTSFCSGGTVQLSVPAVSGVTYSWFTGNTPISNNSNTYTAFATGSYSVVLSNCAGTAQSNSINVLVSGSSTAMLDTSVCGSSFTLNGTSYNAGGSYTQTLTNVNGCDSVLTLNLNLAAAPNQLNYATQNQLCTVPISSSISASNSQYDVYYQLFDGTTPASSQVQGNGGNITLSTTVTGPTTYTVQAEHFANAIKLDGLNDFVRSGVGSILGGMTYQSAYTMEAWVKTPLPGSSAFYPIFFIGNSARSGVECYIQASTQRVVVVHNRGYTGIPIHAKEFPIPPNNTLFHLAITWNGSTIKAFYNGVEQTALATAGAPTAPQVEASNEFVIGSIISSVFNFGVKHFPGLIDEVRVWNIAKNATAISSEMNQCASASNNSLKLYLSFNHPTGTVTPIDKISGLPYIVFNSTNPLYEEGVNVCSFCESSTLGQTITYTVQSGSSSATINPVVCSGSYTAPDGQVYTQSGNYTATIPSAAGCDSIITINLTIGSNESSSVTISQCGTYTSPGGIAYTQSGNYTENFLNAAGCDSIITYNVSINNPSASTQTISQCGSFDTGNGNTYTNSGTYTETLTNSVGCDSVVTWNVTILQPSSFNISPSICAASYTAPNGQVYTQNGNYTIVIPNAAGCDSTISINLTLTNLNADVTVIGNSIAASYAGASYQWIDCNNNNLPIAGATSQNFTATAIGSYAVILTQNGCTAQSACTVISSLCTGSSASIIETVCDTYTAPSGAVYTSSGVYTDVIPNATGCDSTLTINLVVYNSSSETIAVSVANSYQAANGSVYLSDTILTESFVNAEGCDSTLTINVTVVPVNTAVTSSGAVLTAVSSSGATYQWVDCDNNYAAVSGEISPTFTATLSGNYAVIVTINGVSDTSDCYPVSTVGIRSMYSSSTMLSAYPNPVQDFLYIQLQEPTLIEVYTLTGILVAREELSSYVPLHVEAYSSGVYLIKSRFGYAKFVKE